MPAQEKVCFFLQSSLPGRRNKDKKMKAQAKKEGSEITTSPFKDYPLPLTKRLLPWTIYTLLSLVLLRLYLYPLPFLLSTTYQSSPSRPISSISASSLPPSSPKEEEITNETPCDYTRGKWIHEKSGPLYNGTTCGTIKDGQNCIAHGRPDMGYLYWRWKPNQCHLPRFEPNTFLKHLQNKHLAFVGDSMARNQVESLLCMVATVSTPQLVYREGEENKFRRWNFPSHNASVSVYWSPFLVQGIEKSREGPNYNKLYLDRVNERWARDLDQMDMIVLSAGHWFLHPAVYFEGDSVLGCHYCPGMNHTEIGFYDVLRKALRTTLKTIIERKGGKGNDGFYVTVTTFSPAHFEGEWDKFGACSKTKPYDEAEKPLEAMDAEMRKVEIEQVEAAKENAKGVKGVSLEVLDVTKLSLLRPDGHPGPYMNPFPFSSGITERVQNDCVHWCLPGPIDTWNEIFLELIKRWGNLNLKSKGKWGIS